MGNLALKNIIELIGKDQRYALDFCSWVQKLCNPAPSYAAIAEALLQSDFRSTTLEDIAQLAKRIHGNAKRSHAQPKKSPGSPKAKFTQPHRTEKKLVKAHPLVQAQTHSLIPYEFEPIKPDGPPTIRPLEATAPSPPPAALPVPPTSIDVIPRHVLGTIFAESIEERVIGFTGDGPYDADQLTQLALKLKAIPDDETIPWEDLEWVVIGSEGFDLEYVMHAAALRQVRFFTQEEFLGVLMFGDPPLSSAAARWLERTHEGLRFVQKVSQPDRDDDRSVAYPPITQVPLTHPVPPKQPVPSPVQCKPSVVSPPEPARPPVPPPLIAKPPMQPTPASPGRVMPNPVLHQSTARPQVFPGITTIPAYEPAGGWRTQSPPRTSAVPAIPERRGGTPEIERAPVIIPNVETKATQGNGHHDTSKLNLRLESELKRLGYHVRKGGSRTHRKLALQKGVEQLGLQAVVDHLAFLITFHRNSPNKQDAVFYWHEDLQWIKKSYASDRR